ncbi:hypothetical protein N9O61_03105 [Octadecabacter sp.]|nr:hypothetical protein [Octadecabacter sp.]
MLNFYSIHPDIKQPMKADTAALGRLPISAFQYCEALRTASALGWYVFSPADFSLYFDGKEVFIADEGEWRALRSEPLPPELEKGWSDRFEADYGPCPSMLSDFTDTGVVQIFTGLFVTTDPGTWSHIRPLANIHVKSSYWCYEGIVETDSFSPMPLFVNIQLTRTNSEIYFPREFPLFQLSCVPSSLRTLNQKAEFSSVFDEGFPKDGLTQTLRRQPGQQIQAGEYGAGIRKKRKQDKRAGLCMRCNRDHAYGPRPKPDLGTSIIFEA